MQATASVLRGEGVEGSFRAKTKTLNPVICVQGIPVPPVPLKRFRV